MLSPFHLLLSKSPCRLSFSSAQSLSRVWLFATPWTAACQASVSITNSQNLLKLISIESMMPSNHLILCCLHKLKNVSFCSYCQVFFIMKVLILAHDIFFLSIELILFSSLVWCELHWLILNGKLALNFQCKHSLVKMYFLKRLLCLMRVFSFLFIKGML